MSPRSRLGAAAWIVGPLTYLVLEHVAAAALPNYACAQNFISDLGIPSKSPRAEVMNVAFCVQGTLFLAGAMLLSKTRLFVTLVAANAVGNVLVATFHSGVPPHAVGAVLAIVGGNAAILAGARIVQPRCCRWLSIGLGVFGLLSFVIFVCELQSSAALLGLWERCSVYSILVWQMFTAVGVLWSRLDP